MIVLINEATDLANKLAYEEGLAKVDAEAINEEINKKLNEAKNKLRKVSEEQLTEDHVLKQLLYQIREFESIINKDVPNGIDAALKESNAEKKFLKIRDEAAGQLSRADEALSDLAALAKSFAKAEGKIE